MLKENSTETLLPPPPACTMAEARRGSNSALSGRLLGQATGRILLEGDGGGILEGGATSVNGTAVGGGQCGKAGRSAMF